MNEHEPKKTPGVFQMQNARDLLAKLRHDVERLRADKLDGYAAFDVFVTARHLPDWINEGDTRKSDALFERHVELRICRHLADQAKHYLVTARKHKQIQEASRETGAWGMSWGQSWGGSWGRNALVVRLNTADADTVAVGAEIEALDLAERVLAILEAHVEALPQKGEPA